MTWSHPWFLAYLPLLLIASVVTRWPLTFNARIALIAGGAAAIFLELYRYVIITSALLRAITGIAKALPQKPMFLPLDNQTASDRQES